jgi:hypothetical protein
MRQPPVSLLAQLMGWMQMEALPDARFQKVPSPVLMLFLIEHYCPPDPEQQYWLRPTPKVQTLH